MNTATILKIALVAGGLAAGCAQMQRYPAPTPDIFTRAGANIDLAAKTVSADDEYATQHLQLARNQLTEAQSAMNTGQTDRAGLLVARAEADAELAIKLAEKGKVSREALRAEREAATPAPGAAAPASAAPASGASTPPVPGALVPATNTGAAQ